jgi:LacI family transcriptional regulator
MTDIRSGEGKRAATLSDVALLAGVSRATASKAMNNRSQVSADARQRVRDAAEALSFTPNAFARALNSNRTNTIGMLTVDLESRFVTPVLMGAEDAFGSGSMSVLLCDSRDDAVREQHHLRMLLSRKVDGILVVGRTTNPRPSITADLPVPVVYVYAPSEDPADLSFTPDNRQAGRIAIEHLVATGHRRIAFVNGEPSYAAAQDRAAGVHEAIASAGLELVGGDNFSGSWGERWGRHCTQQLIDAGEHFDAILCGSDQSARGALDELRARGISVPKDVAVMGFDNWDVLTTESQPPLSSVDMNLQNLGRSAAIALVNAIGGDHPHGIELGRVRVVPRESTATL